MHNLTTNTKIFLLSYGIITIPFLEFFNSNINNIDIDIFIHLIGIYIITFISISFINYIFLKLSKTRSQIYVLAFSFFFWLLFRFKSIKDFLGGDSFKFSAELSLLILLVILCFFIFFISKEKIYKGLYKFLVLFFIFQNVILLIFILLSNLKLIDVKDFKNNVYQKYVSHINQEREYFSEDEIVSVKKNLNKNIYFFIFDGMTSLEMYKKWNTKDNINTNNIKEKFLDKNYIYIENSYSSYNFTSTTFGSMLQMQPLFIDGVTRYDKIYKEQLFPQNLSRRNFQNNKHPNLIHNLNKLDYRFIWLGSPVGCEIYNPETCINFEKPNKSKGLKLNWYILDTFLENTPLIQIYNLISDYLFKEKTLVFVSKNNEKFDYTDEFIINSHITTEPSSKRNYFYLIHNLFPKARYVFDRDCKNGFKKNKFELNEYIINYNCALKSINKLIIFLEENDPDAVVVFQSDHGFIFDKKNDNLETKNTIGKIFNLIKVPQSCKNVIDNNLDNINSVRLALSCATNTKPKLLERKVLNPL